MAGIIASEGWNDKGIRGIAPKANLIHSSFTNKSFEFGKKPALDKTFEILSFGGDYDYNCSVDPLEMPNEITCKNIMSMAVERYNTTKSVNIFNSTLDFSSKNPKLLDPELEKLFWSDQIPISQSTKDHEKQTGAKTVIFIRGAGDGSKNFGNENQGCNQNNTSCQITGMDPRANHPAMINVAALDEHRKIADYSAYGAANWISAPGGVGSQQPGSRGITTTCHHGDDPNDCDDNYTDIFYGTSAAAAMVSGVVALMLEANAYLTWRDIKYILAKTAIKIDENNNGWITNSADYNFHNAYGFGALDAEAAVGMAKHYKERLGQIDKVENQPDNFKRIGFVNVNSSNTFLEAVKVYIKFGKPDEDYWCQKDPQDCDANLASLSFYLVSPSGATSEIISPYAIDKDIDEIELSTNAFYGEPASGQWELIIKYSGIEILDNDYVTILSSFELKLYGTKTDISRENP